MDNLSTTNRLMKPIRSNASRFSCWHPPRIAAVLLLWVLLPALAWAAPNAAKVTGPEKCKDCHENAFYAWESTHHHALLTRLFTNKVDEILGKMDLRSARGDAC